MLQKYLPAVASYSIRRRLLTTLRTERALKESHEQCLLAHAFNTSDTKVAVDERAHQSANSLARSIASRDSLLHTLQVRPAGESGEGVFVSNPLGIKRGATVCFYGGLLFTQKEVEWLGSHPVCFQQSDTQLRLTHLLACFNGDVLNGVDSLSEVGVQVNVTESNAVSMQNLGGDKVGWVPDLTFECVANLQDREGKLGMVVDFDKWDARRKKNDMLSMGSKINHPNGAHANVIGVPVTLSKGLRGLRGGSRRGATEEEEEPFYPSAHAVRSAMHDQCQIVCSEKTIVFVAIADIEQDDEVLLDYGLEFSGVDAPDWFEKAKERKATGFD